MMVYLFKANASYIVLALTKICVFLIGFEPSEGHYIIQNSVLKSHLHCQ